ncbi:hypothetical protein IQ254_19130 [Nodosilinea sp. LEGE 07088]|uniref:hypothetical protein n=1 Tax=Nodosilinea sp. LEGE 07088 TaxID=2777968 RepID=UPI00187F1A69|nr:hypothetical protein [Nodosilinea sp. LEGE 07088]MBE9139285.1 hypothetical protein [Nodosilinea sp. LEGE 07088]
MVDKIIPPALKIWLVFLFVFLLLDYGVVSSILLGAIAGFAGGTINAWWITLGGEPTTTLEIPASLRQFSRKQLPLKNLFRRDGRQRVPRARR